MPEEMSFEETLTKLEEAVERLESGESLTLDESLEVFEEGIRLARIGRKKLDDAELRVQRLIEIDEDEFETVPFEADEDMV
ncbi:exodeoxyribonuclease VII small subunit [Candidatus Poribacteria bacterium]|nr:exodeoxyribonuclease VII small subunit [Candidatus Poribacteria bacterium]